MREPEEYRFLFDGKDLPRLAEQCYRNVFRNDFKQPGFIVIDLKDNYDSVHLRETMVRLKERLGELLLADRSLKLNYLWMGRFDQQETTKFHRDNAPDESFLMLGYEPTAVKSRLYFADYLLFARSINVGQEEYFEKYNPIYTAGEKYLEPFITEVRDFNGNAAKIVLMNNSTSLNVPGVLHKAVVPQKNDSFPRVINSTMIYSASPAEEDPFSAKQQEDFIRTDKVSGAMRK